MVLLVVLHTVLTSGQTVDESTRPAPAAERSTEEGPSRPSVGPEFVAAPKRERCPDGSDPTASLRPSADAGKAVRRIVKRGQLLVGVDQNSYHWSFRDPQTGALKGFDIELVEAIATDLLGPQARIVYKAIPTSQRFAALENHDVDMVVRTVTINCERVDKVAFSTAYFEAGQQILVPHRSRITGYDASLEGHTLCTAESSTGETVLKQEAYGAVVKTLPNHLDCLVRLQLGQVDGIVTDNALAAGHAAQDPAVRLVGELFTIEPYGVAMNLQDEDLVRRVNRVLDAFRSGGKSSQWRLAYEKWLGDVLDESSAVPPKPVYRD